jgi:tyrosyl-tRNA synthetase
MGYPKRAHLMNPMVPSLEGGKMSASSPNSKIDLLDPPEVVRKKIRSAFCQERNVDDNPVLSFVQAVLIPVSRLRLERRMNLSGGHKPPEGSGKKEGERRGDEEPQKPFVGEDAPPGTLFTIKKGEKSGGGSLHYASFEDLRKDFAEGRIHPGDLKDTVTTAILSLLEPIRQTYETSEEWKAVEKLAYPDPNTKVQKKKKVI